MKRYEKFNEMSSIFEGPETQAIGMILAELQVTFDIDEDLSKYVRKFRGILDWLNEEV